MEIVNRNRWLLFRIIVPAFPEVNIFTRQAQKTTALGPVIIATSADKVWGWRVEVIDENNYKGPCGRDGLPDHKRLQEENPADVVGFYCGLTSTMERVWKLAKFYQEAEVFTLAGGWHALYCAEETLKHNINIIVRGEGEIAIQQTLRALREKESLEDISGISFLKEGRVKTNAPGMLRVDLNDLPYPDFGLLKYAKKIKVYPIGRIRGCSNICEFCSVKGKPHWASPKYFFDTVKWLVETREAIDLFIVDDRSEEDSQGMIEFFEMIADQYGRRLRFTIQVSLEVAKNVKLLAAMRKAGVRTLCIGYESPIDKQLKTMHKKYTSSEMIELTKIIKSFGFQIHQMLIFGYPPEEKEELISTKEMIRLFEDFIRKSKPDTLQVLSPVPLPGTGLRKRLQRDGRIFPAELVSWNRYDGSFACFMPDGDMTIQQLQEIPKKLMRRFYDPLSLFRAIIRILVFPVDYFVRGWSSWRRGFKKDVTKYGGHLLIQRWQKRQQGKDYIRKLENYQSEQTNKK